MKSSTAPASIVPISDVRFIKELYPRLKPSDEIVERYRDALEKLPPIVVARGGLIVDGYHRWQAHVREGAESIAVEDLGNLTDAEIVRESIKRNSSHGYQLTRQDKKKLAGQLWQSFGDSGQSERVKEIAALLAVTERTVQEWTKEARKAEKEAQQAKAWDLWLECHSDRDISKMMSIADRTISEWLREKRNSADFAQPPDSREHFDVWQFASAEKDAGQQSYFGALPPQVVENLLWLFTEPGDIVVDPFAGSGTTIEVAKRMGRRVWASDRIGDKYAPYLPIHTHNIADAGWPEGAPKNADLVILDPPYWQQAKGKYSDDIDDMGNCSLEVFNGAWAATVTNCATHTKRIAYIISPTQTDDGVIDHATDMLIPFKAAGWHVERRIIVPYQTQQATGQQVEWARKNRKLLKLYRDLVVMAP